MPEYRDTAIDDVGLAWIADLLGPHDRQICRPVRASIAVTVRGLPPLVPYMTPSTTSGVLSLTVSPGTIADHAARNCATLAGVMLERAE